MSTDRNISLFPFERDLLDELNELEIIEIQPGTYLILFRGVSSDGNIVYGLNHFNVD
ncbi:MAG: hypothetical protein KAS29_00100 [Bacteroidales bacterium]|nr:hypothetical protein [Bacteroidales bacterium]